MADLVVKHNVNPSPRQLQGTNVGAVFGAGRIALLAQGQQLGYTRTLGASPPAFSWGVAALPKGPAGRFALNIGTAYALTKGGRQPGAGREVAGHRWLRPRDAELRPCSPHEAAM